MVDKARGATCGQSTRRRVTGGRIVDGFEGSRPWSDRPTGPRAPASIDKDPEGLELFCSSPE